MSHQDKKKHKLRWLMARVLACEKAGFTAHKRKLIAEMVMEYGAGERYIKELFQTLEEIGQIYIKGNEVLSAKGWEAEKTLHRAELNPEKEEVKEEGNTETKQGDTKENGKNQV